MGILIIIIPCNTRDENRLVSSHGPGGASQRARGTAGFASEDPLVLVVVLGDWSVYARRPCEWGWRCVACGEARRGYPGHWKQAAVNAAEGHNRWHQRQAHWQ